MATKNFIKALIPCLFPGAGYSLFAIRYSLPFAFRKGQNTVEYIMMLAVVASVALAMGMMFHKKILGGIFTLVGMIIGAGQPK
jgi:hypothetical protein